MDTDIARTALDAFDGLVAALADLERLAANGQARAHWARSHHRGETERRALGVGMLDNITDEDTLGAPVAPRADASAHLRLAWEGAVARASSCGDALWESLAQHPTLGPILLDHHGGTNPNGMVRGPHLHVQVQNTVGPSSTGETLVSLGLGTLSPPPAMGGPQTPHAVARAALAKALSTQAGPTRTVFAVEPNGEVVFFGLALGPCIDQGGVVDALLPLMAVHKQARWHLAMQVPSPTLPHRPGPQDQEAARARRLAARDAWAPIERAVLALDRATMGLAGSQGQTLQIRRVYGETQAGLWRDGKRIGATALVLDAIEGQALPLLDAIESWIGAQAPWLASTPRLGDGPHGRLPSRLGLSWDKGTQIPRAFVYRAMQHGHPLSCMEEAPDAMVARPQAHRPYGILTSEGTVAYLWSPDTDTAWGWVDVLDSPSSRKARGLATPMPLLLDLDPDMATQATA